jgi:hypothetical protein
VIISVALGIHQKLWFDTYENIIQNSVLLLSLAIYYGMPFLLILLIVLFKSKIEAEEYWIDHFKRSKAY